MAQKTKTTADVDVQAANEIYEVAQQQANQQLQAMQAEVDDIRQESFALGSIRALDSMTAYTELMKHVTLFRIKEHKEYRKGGMTWDGFCESIGLDRRNVDNIINDLAPLMADFSEKVSLIANIPFNKIRHLGRQISGNFSEIKDGVLIYGDERIPVTPENADELQALIEKIDEDAKTAKDEATATIKAKDKVLKAKEDVIKKQEKTLLRLEREASDKDLTPDEDAFLQRMENLRTSFDGYMMKLDAQGSFLFEEISNETPRMKAALISTAHYFKMQILATYDQLVTTYGDPTMNPELLEDFEKWQAQQG